MANAFDKTDFGRRVEERRVNDQEWMQHDAERIHQLEECDKIGEEREYLKTQKKEAKDAESIKTISQKLKIIELKEEIALSRYKKAIAQANQRYYELSKQMLEEELLHPTNPQSKHEIEALIRTTDKEIDFRNERVKTMESEVLQWEMKLTETEKEYCKPQKDYHLAELTAREGYECVAHSSFGLVYLSSDSTQNVSIEAVSDLKLHPKLQVNEIMLTPVAFAFPDEKTFTFDPPAIIELMKTIVPTNQNPQRKLVPLFSLSNPFQWKELISHDCKMLEDRVVFKTTQLGYLTVIARFPFPSARVVVEPTVNKPAELEIQEFPGFAMEIPPTSVKSSTEITATVRYDDPKFRDTQKERSLASACVTLEPHNAQFENRVKITLPIPNYDKITQRYPDIKLEMWHGKSSNQDPNEWEIADNSSFTIHYDEKGNCLATAYITHFSNIMYWWNKAVDWLNFFATSVRGRCQVFMSHETKRGSTIRFGISVLLYPFQESYSMLPNLPYLLYDSAVPIQITVGEVECQLALDNVLQCDCPNYDREEYIEHRYFSEEYNMRVDFHITLNVGTAEAELPAGDRLATLFIKHGSKDVINQYKFDLIKPLETSFDPISPSNAKKLHCSLIQPSLRNSGDDLPTVSCPSEEKPQILLHVIGDEAQKLLKTTKRLKENVIVRSAMRIAELMKNVAQLACVPESAENEELVAVIHSILKESSDIEKLSRKVAEACPEKWLKKNVLEVVDRIPSIAHQLKVVSSGMKKKNYEEETAKEAADLLTRNAINLISAVESVLYATESAYIQLPQSEIQQLKLNPEITTTLSGSDTASIVVKLPAHLARSTSRLKDSDLRDIQPRVWDARSEWFNIGIQLKFSSGDLAAIKTDKQDCDKCFTAMLIQWLKRSNPIPSWKALVEAMDTNTVGIKVKLEPKGSLH